MQKVKTLLAPRALSNVAKLANGGKFERVRLDANLGILDRVDHSKDESNVVKFKHGELVCILIFRNGFSNA